MPSAGSGAQDQLAFWDKSVKSEHAQVAWGGSCAARGDGQEVSLHCLRRHQYLGSFSEKGHRHRREAVDLWRVNMQRDFQKLFCATPSFYKGAEAQRTGMRSLRPTGSQPKPASLTGQQSAEGLEVATMAFPNSSSRTQEFLIYLKK